MSQTMRHKLLLVDDSTVNLMVLEELFEEDFDVVTAQCGEDAVALVESEHPDVVLLDVMMPGMDGLEACRQIRSRPVHARTVVYMVSARSTDEDICKGIDAGADDYFIKPIDLDALSLAVSAALDVPAEPVDCVVTCSE